MTLADWSAILAVVISMLSLLISYYQNRKLAGENIRLQEAAYYADRNFAFESKLADWPDALRFFGIDVEEAKNNDGISESQITYLVLSVHALHSYCRASKESLYQHIKNSDYRQRMFANQETRRAWKYARQLFSDYIRSDIDKFLNEEYP